MEGWQIALIVIASVLLIIIALSVFMFVYAGKSMKNMLNRCDNGFKQKGAMNMDVSFYQRGPVAPLAEQGVKYMEEIGHEDVYITSFDGFKLHAYLFKNPNGETNKYFLGMHGFRSGPRHEYGPYIKKYFELGFNVIVPDERAHYMSEGDYITMGAKERYDVLSWANYLVKEYGENIKILIQGISMGGASVCLASNLDLPKQVMGIVSDCAYSSFEDQIRHTMKYNFKIPAFPIMNILAFNVKKFGIDFKGETPVSAVKNAKVPILFMHGEKDEIVPVELAYKLYDACGSRKKLNVVKNANHAESEATDIEAYFNEIVNFFPEINN